MLPGAVLSWGLRHRVPTLKLSSIPKCALYGTEIRSDRELYAVYREAVKPRAMQRYLNRFSPVEITPNSVFSIHLEWIGEKRVRPVITEHSGLHVQRGSETEEWIARFTEETPDLIGMRFRPHGGAARP